MTGAELIAAERQRQVDVEGWTPEHDDEHTGRELARAAACYATNSRWGMDNPGVMPFNWPWEWDAWKPSADEVRNLVRAGALIAAEIDRLRRRKATP